MRLELSGLRSDPVSYTCVPECSPQHTAFPFPFSLFLLFLHQGVNRHSYTEESAVAGRGGEGGLLKTIQPGNQAVHENPASGTGCCREGAGLRCLVLKETGKTLPVTCIVGLYSTCNRKSAFFGQDSIYNPG